MSETVVFRFGKAGFDLYKELHLTRTNEIVHGLGMPFVVLGVFLWLPAFLRLNTVKSRQLTQFIYFAYLIYYGLFDPKGMILCSIVYFPCLLVSMDLEYDEETHRKHLLIGLSLMTT